MIYKRTSMVVVSMQLVNYVMQLAMRHSGKGVQSDPTNIIH